MPVPVPEVVVVVVVVVVVAVVPRKDTWGWRTWGGSGRISCWKTEDAFKWIRTQPFGTSRSGIGVKNMLTYKAAKKTKEVVAS